MSNVRLGYRPALDGLRAISILGVMYHHAEVPPLRFFENGAPAGEGGFLGVDIFFVLSGFLITALLVDEWRETGAIGLGRFYLRRGLRLFPALAALILACLVGMTLVTPARGWATEASSILVAALYAANYLVPTPYLAHTWSLCVEEQFYLLWPLLLYAGLRWKLPARRLLGLTLAMVAVVAIHRAYDAYVWYGRFPGVAPAPYPYHLYGRFDTRADSLLVGCAAGILVSFGMIPRSQWASYLVRGGAWLSALLLALALIGAGFDARHWYYGSFTLVAVLAGALIVGLCTQPLPWVTRVLGLSWLVGVGRISYGLYLWHYPIYFVYDHSMPAINVHSYTVNLFGPAVVKMALSFCAAALSFHFIERPALRLKAQFARRGRE